MRYKSEIRNPKSEISRLLYPNVHIGPDATLDDFIIIGLPPRGAEPGQLPTRIGENAVIRSHAVIYAGNTIGDNFETGHHVMIREENTIGDNVSVGTSSVIEHHVEIGDAVRIHSQAFIPEYSVLEDNCWIGPNVVFTNALHPLCPRAKQCSRGPTIKQNVKIGANATLLPDVTVGENALIGAGSVVVKSVPPCKVATGNPARVVKDISELTCPYELVEKPYQSHFFFSFRLSAD